MGKDNEIRRTIISIIKDINDVEICDPDMSLFGVEYNFVSADLLILCMELKKKYMVDLNELVPKLNDYSINELANEVAKLI